MRSRPEDGESDPGKPAAGGGPQRYLQHVREILRRAQHEQGAEQRIYRHPVIFLRRLRYEKSTGLVFVTGQSVAVGPGGDEKRKERTYEFLIEIRNFMPLLSRMDTYQGSARTSRVREKLRARDNRNGAGRNKDNRRRDDHNEY